ncbi:MAG: hypothetical protein SGJ27_13660 [Candidatus Melainabacteria bacterium]|nr:hypothetical protein [Candidatus Melainabacteria bacterium]
MATRSVSGIIDRCNNQRTMFYLDRLLAIHVANQHQIREICRTLRYSPGDEIEIPSQIAKLMEKKNVPDRLMLSWLVQCESKLADLYEVAESTPLPDGLSGKFKTVRNRQQAMLEELNILKLDSTEVLDSTAWDF